MSSCAVAASRTTRGSICAGTSAKSCVISVAWRRGVAPAATSARARSTGATTTQPDRSRRHASRSSSSVASSAGSSRSASGRSPRSAGVKVASVRPSGALSRGDLVVAGVVRRRRLGHERGRVALLDRLARDDALLDVAARGQLELHVEQRLFDDRAQAAGAGLALETLVGDARQRVLAEDELDAIEAEEALELLDERVARLGQDRDQVVAGELVHGAHDRQTADELRDQAVVDEVLGQALGEQVAGVLVGLGLDRGAEPDALVADAPLDDLVEVRERAAADEQDVRRVDRQELLVGMLAAALRRDAGGRPLEDLQERLLDALAGDVARDRRVVRLAGDLVDLVDVDDPGLGLLDVVVGRLDQLEQDVLDVLA